MKTIMIPINKKYISTEYKQFDIPNQVAKYIQELEEQLESKIDLYEDTISYQLGFDKGKEQLKQEILEFIDTLQGGDKQEFMGYGGYELLEILGDDKNV